MAGTDFSHLTSDELIKGIQALDLPDYIRSKGHGIDVRETLAQMTEMLMQLAYNQGMNPQQAQDFVYRINNKINRGEVSMSDLTQEVKEALTGGAVAVVGKNAVGTENLKNRSVTPSRMAGFGSVASQSFYTYKDVVNINTVNYTVEFPSFMNLRFGETFFVIPEGGIIKQLEKNSVVNFYWNVTTNEIVSYPQLSNMVGNSFNNLVYIMGVSMSDDPKKVRISGSNNYTINKLKDSDYLTQGISVAHLHHETGRLPNLDTTTGILTIYSPSHLKINSKNFLFAENVSIPLFSPVISYPSSLTKLVFNIDTKSFYLETNSLDLKINEVSLGIVKYSNASNESLVSASFDFPFTIDGLYRGVINSSSESKTHTINNPLFIPKKMKLIGHRGMSALEPENTIPAFRRCLTEGHFAFETDLRITKDGELVLIHDKTVDRTTDGTGNVAEMTLAEIKTLNINAGTNISSYPNLKIPTLKEGLELCVETGLVMFLDIYTWRDTVALRKMVEEVKEMGMEGSVIYGCGVVSDIQFIRSISTSLIAYMVSYPDTPDISLVDTVSNLFYYLDTRYYTDDVNLISQIHDKSTLATGWVVNDSAIAKDLMKKGIDFIATDILSVNDIFNS